MGHLYAGPDREWVRNRFWRCPFEPGDQVDLHGFGFLAIGGIIIPNQPWWAVIWYRVNYRRTDQNDPAYYGRKFTFKPQDIGLEPSDLEPK